MTSEIDFRLNAASRDIEAVDRNTHLKSADFFDIENHKQISFKGKSFKKVDDNSSFTLFGDLTIKDITKPIKLDVKFI